MDDVGIAGLVEVGISGDEGPTLGGRRIRSSHSRVRSEDARLCRWIRVPSLGHFQEPCYVPNWATWLAKKRGDQVAGVDRFRDYRDAGDHQLPRRRGVCECPQVLIFARGRCIWEPTKTCPSASQAHSVLVFGLGRDLVSFPADWRSPAGR